MKDCKQDCENYKPKPAIWQSQRSGTYTSPPAWPASSKPKPALYCRGWGQCTSLAKAESQPCCGCSSYEPDEPAPEPSVEERLRKAGATCVIDYPHEYENCTAAEAFIYLGNDKTTLHLHGLTPDRAEAALKASRGEFPGGLCCVGCADLERLTRQQQQLAAAQAEVERLTAAVIKLEADVDEGDKCAMRDRDEIKRLKGEIATIQRDKDIWKKYAHKEALRVKELEQSIQDQKQTIAGLRRIQDMLVRNKEA